jgi:hypothetical protein
MYSLLLTIHSLVRWLVLVSLVYALYRAYRGWLGNHAFSQLDNTVRHTTATIAHVQLLLGLWLYLISPLVAYFLANFSTAVHERQVRFFGMEHSSMMLVAVILISIGSSLAKRKPTDQARFKTMAIWFTAGLVLILANIPWAFSPLVSRPYFRPLWE